MRKRDNGKKYNNRIFKTFLRSYMIVMLIPLLVSLIAYSNMRNTALSTEASRLEYIASQVGSIADAELSGVSSLVYQTLASPYLASLITSDGLDSDNALITNAMSFKRNLSTIVTGMLPENFLVYFRKPNMLFCKTGEVYYEPYAYIQSNLKLSDMDKDEWLGLLNNTRTPTVFPRRDAQIKRQSEFGNAVYNDGRVMLYTYPILRNGDLCGNMVAVLRADTLTRIMSKAVGSSTDIAFWIDNATGTKLLWSPDSALMIETDSTDWIIERYHSGEMDLTYNVALPKSVALINVYRSVGYILIILAAALIVGLLLAILLAYRQGVPLDNISRNLSLLYEDTIEPQRNLMVSPNISYIDTSINQLINRHNAVKSYLSRQTGLVERMFFEKLYAGLFDSEQDIIEMLGHLDIRPIDEPKRLLLLRLEQYTAPVSLAGEQSLEPLDIVNELALDDSDRLTRRLDEALEEMAGHRYHRYEPSLSSCVLLLSMDTEDDSDLRKLTHKLAAAFTDDIRLRCALSEQFDNYTDAWAYYRNCIEALQHSDAGLVIAQAQGVHTALDYPVEVESRLISLTFGGKSQSVIAALDKLAADNTDVPPEQFAQALNVTIARLRAQISERSPEACALIDEAGELDFRGGVSAVCTQAGRLLAEVCEKTAPSRSPRANHRLDSVVKYINENYTRQDMSLSMLADRFNLTETYLSHVYKTYTGMNISGHIEKLRIERAQELLKQGQTLEQTASDVGYGHVYSFRTAFKRVTGMTPGTYRDG